MSDWAEISCDVRHRDLNALQVMRERLERSIGEAAARAGCTAKVIDRWTYGGDLFDMDMIDLVRDTAAALGFSSRSLASQAGHDAYFIAKVCPTAMIFTPCVDGITHNNRGYVASQDLEPGLNVLLHAAYARASW